jgi:hypothetical protein
MRSPVRDAISALKWRVFVVTSQSGWARRAATRMGTSAWWRMRWRWRRMDLAKASRPNLRQIPQGLYCGDAAGLQCDSDPLAQFLKLEIFRGDSDGQLFAAETTRSRTDRSSGRPVTWCSAVTVFLPSRGRHHGPPSNTISSPISGAESTELKVRRRLSEFLRRAAKLPAHDRLNLVSQLRRPRRVAASHHGGSRSGAFDTRSPAPRPFP